MWVLPTEDSRLKKAKLRQQGCFEDIDFRAPRGLDKQLILSLASCDWINKAYNILITGATGTGKSYLACALAHKACLEGHTVRYMRLPRLMEDIFHSPRRRQLWQADAGSRSHRSDHS